MSSPPAFRPRLSVSGVSTTGDGILSRSETADDRVNGSVVRHMVKARNTAIAKNRVPKKFVLNAIAVSKFLSETKGQVELYKGFMGIPVEIKSNSRDRNATVALFVSKA